MKQDPDRLQYLFELFVLKQCSPQELDELFDLLKKPAYEVQAREALEVYFDRPLKEPEIDKAIWLSKLERLKQAADEDSHPLSAGRSRIHSFSRWGVAAAVLLIAAGLTWIRIDRPAKKETTPVVVVPHDLPAPSSSNAILTLADGKKISLDSAANGLLADQGSTRVTKQKDGQIVYAGNGHADGSHAADSHAGGMQYNRLEVPRGSRIANITLDDGTRVWLNSGSSLKYPVAFAAQERKVEITGEAYFEVAKREGQAFFVSGGGLVTEVLGTHFNVNVYEDETEQRVTVLEGAIRVNKGNEQNIIRPGEQVRINNSGHMDLLRMVDLDEVMAWKNAMFVMERSDVGTVMRQISRWYNVQVVYKNGIPKGELSGDITRNMELSKVLKVMELSGIHFSMEDGKVIVSP